MIDNFMRLEDLINNPTPRVPVCLCLDISGSMQGSPIRELNDGVKLFYDAIKADETALYSAEISVVTFGGNAKCESDFSSLELQPNPPSFSATGGTPMGEAVNMALDMLEKRKSEYRDKGVDYYQPWLVLMTDGEPNGSSSELNRAVNRTVELVKGRKLTVFPIGIGSGADMKVLERFSPNRKPVHLIGLNFSKFFSWLSKSVSTTSQSIPGEFIKLDIEGMKDWAEL